MKSKFLVPVVAFLALLSLAACSTTGGGELKKNGKDNIGRIIDAATDRVIDRIDESGPGE